MGARFYYFRFAVVLHLAAIINDVQSSSISDQQPKNICSELSKSNGILVLGQVRDSEDNCIGTTRRSNLTVEVTNRDENPTLLCRHKVRLHRDGKLKVVLPILLTTSQQGSKSFNSSFRVKLCAEDSVCSVKIVQLADEDESELRLSANDIKAEVVKAYRVHSKTQPSYKLNADWCLFSTVKSSIDEVENFKNGSQLSKQQQSSQIRHRTENDNPKQQVISAKLHEDTSDDNTKDKSASSLRSPSTTSLQSNLQANDYKKRHSKSARKSVKSKPSNNRITVLNVPVITRKKRNVDKRNWDDVGMGWMKRDEEKRNWDDVGMGWMKRDEEKRNWDDVGMGWMKKDVSKRNWDDVGMGWMKRDEEKRNWDDVGMGWMKRDVSKRTWDDGVIGSKKRVENKRNWDDVGMGWMKRGEYKRNWDDVGMGWMKRDHEKRNWDDVGMGWMKRDEKRK